MDVRNRKHFKSRLKKDYQAKTLKNPFFRARQKNYKPRKILKLGLFSALLLLLVLAWLLFFSPLLLIKNVVIEGLTRLPQETILGSVNQKMAGKSGLIFPNNNLLLVKARILSETINQEYNFAAITVEKKWWSRNLVVKVTERSSALIWRDQNQECYTDVNGNLIKEEPVSDEGRQRLLILENRSSSSTMVSGNCLSFNKEYLPFIFSLSEKIKTMPDLIVDRFYLDNELNTIKVVLGGGPELYFNVREGVDSQLAKLSVVKSQTIKDNFNKLRYIDLRYQDKVYYQ